jgi:glycosyltransferase involved in cell wall biosynthesis
MKVLYIDGVGPFGGASRSLYEAVGAFAKGKVKAYFLIAKGTSLAYYSRLAEDLITTVGLTRFDNTVYSHYRGARWLILFRELFHLPFTIISLIQARRRWKDIEVIHVNELTEILPMLLARWLFKVPVVVHVRSLTWNKANSWRCRFVHYVLRNKVNAVIAIDESVRSSLPQDVPVHVVHNSFTPKSLPEPDREFLSKIDAIDPQTFKVGFVGNLLHAKGIFDLLEAAKIIKDSGRKVDVLIVGDEARKGTGLKAWLLKRLGLSQDLKAELVDKINQYGLTDDFHLLGSTPDIQRAYSRFDVLCFPSHFDAPGRPIFEAAFSGVPSIVAINKPKPDTLIHLKTGLAIAEKDPKALADAILYFVDNPAETKDMGENARNLARQNFSVTVNSQLILNIYDSIVADKVPVGSYSSYSSTTFTDNY